jgi:hypothetical protein
MRVSIPHTTLMRVNMPCTTLHYTTLHYTTLHYMNLTLQFLGRLAARCLMDGQVLPLPLSTDFTRLILACATAATTTTTSSSTTATASTTATSTASASDSTPTAVKTGRLFSAADLPRLYLQPGAIVQRLHRALASTTANTTVVSDATAVLVDGIRLDTWLDAVCLSMVDPLTGERLEADGVNGPGLRGMCQTVFETSAAVTASVCCNTVARHVPVGVCSMSAHAESMPHAAVTTDCAHQYLINLKRQ